MYWMDVQGHFIHFNLFREKGGEIKAEAGSFFFQAQ